MKRLFVLLFSAILIFSVASCGDAGITVTLSSPSPVDDENDIIVLFTNDVHCALDENIGYAGLAAYKKSLEEKTPYVTLVDCGDAIQGTNLGTVSSGSFPIEAMNEVGYDFAVIGNHGFDYGPERLSELIDLSDTQYLCANIYYSGNGDCFLSRTKPYEIVTYGDTKVAYIGISTPNTIKSTTPKHFKEDGVTVYDFSGADAEYFYSTVQAYVDECKSAGSDYVILLSHLGMNFVEDSPFTSAELVENTTGVDVVLDGHSHDKLPSVIKKNKDGKDVLIAQSGEYLENIGQLVISPTGFISTGLISGYEEKDPDIEAFIGTIHEDFDEMMNRVVAHIDFDLPIMDADGSRLARLKEMGIGDLVTDAIRFASGADIAYMNGGGIRNGLSEGDLTFSDLINVTPYGNMICMTEVTGQELLDMLEYFYSLVMLDEKGNPINEHGSFGQFSGLKVTVHTDIPSSTVTDEDDALVAVGDTRRVSDVMVLQDGEYVPVDPEGIYTIASHDYMIKNGGSGMGVILKDHPILLDGIGLDYQVLTDYVISLNNDFSAYEAPEGRITITK